MPPHLTFTNPIDACAMLLAACSTWHTLPDHPLTLKPYTPAVFGVLTLAPPFAVPC